MQKTKKQQQALAHCSKQGSEPADQVMIRGVCCECTATVNSMAQSNSLKGLKTCVLNLTGTSDNMVTQQHPKPCAYNDTRP